jgi:hypothetical protein
VDMEEVAESGEEKGPTPKTDEQTLA